MTMQIADITMHIDETLSRHGRSVLESTLRAIEGVISVGNNDMTPHLIIVGYNPHKASSQQLLNNVTKQGLHAELIGL